MRYTKEHGNAAKYLQVFFDHYEILPHELRCAVCGKIANNVQHIKGRGKYLLDVDYMLPVCQHPCHWDCERKKYSVEEQISLLQKWRENIHR